MVLHSAFRKNKKVFVIMKNGRKIIDRFIDKCSGSIILKENGKVGLSEIRSATIHSNRGINVS
jgi:hypothetical protein